MGWNATEKPPPDGRSRAYVSAPVAVGEVATAARLGLSLPIVVLDDRWLALIKVKQERRAYPYFGTELPASPPPAHYFGVPAIAVASPDALDDALARALAADHPTVIEAAVDAAHYSETVYD